MKLVIIATASLLPLLYGPTSRADTGLAHKCFDSDGASKGTGSGLPLCVSRGWVRPAAGDAILSCLAPTNPAAPNECLWGSADARFREWIGIPETAIIQTCSLDVPVGPFPNPPADPCGSAVLDKPWLLKNQVLIPQIIPVKFLTFEWIPPVMYVDNSPLDPAVDLSSYRLEGARTLGGPYNLRIPVEGGATMEAVVDHEDGLAPGGWFFRAFAIGTDGQESGPSNVVEASVVTLNIPSQPENLEVTGELLYAYSITQTRDRITLVPVGTLAPETPCFGSSVTDEEGLTAYRVPYESVIWAGSVRPEVVFSECAAP